MSRYGFAITERREILGYKTQRELARALKALEEEGELPEGLKSFSQQWLSIMERDRNGEKLQSGHPKQMRALAYMLQWSSEEFERYVGVPVGSVPTYDTPIRNAVDDGFSSEPLGPKPIPESLRQAAEMFGGEEQFAELREYRWQRFLADLRHKKTPTTPAAWFALFLDLRERFEAPEVSDGPAH